MVKNIESLKIPLLHIFPHSFQGVDQPTSNIAFRVLKATIYIYEAHHMQEIREGPELWQEIYICTQTFKNPGIFFVFCTPFPPSYIKEIPNLSWSKDLGWRTLHGLNHSIRHTIYRKLVLIGMNVVAKLGKLAPCFFKFAKALYINSAIFADYCKM